MYLSIYLYILYIDIKYYIYIYFILYIFFMCFSLVYFSSPRCVVLAYIRFPYKLSPHT